MNTCTDTLHQLRACWHRGTHRRDRFCTSKVHLHQHLLARGPCCFRLKGATRAGAASPGQCAALEFSRIARHRNPKTRHLTSNGLLSASWGYERHNCFLQVLGTSSPRIAGRTIKRFNKPPSLSGAKCSLRTTQQLFQARWLRA